jgi:hypothetical protein
MTARPAVRSPWRSIAALVSGLLLGAWTLPEHRDISAAALEQLTPERRLVFDKAWELATGQHPEMNACARGVDPGGVAGTCIDLAMWPALAGDHSCSPDELTNQIVTAPWIMKVAKEGSDFRKRLAAATREDEVLDAWAVDNIKLEQVDPDYSSRAGANSAHFLLPRTENVLKSYMEHSVAPDTEPNALGLYVHFHLAALALAHEWHEHPGDRMLAMRMLSTEAFALHFLEDSFSAGHVAGTWGNVAERKGTHDYYCEKGIDTATWGGELQAIKGDAHMRPEDLARTASLMAVSLGQVADAARGVGAPAKVGAAIDPKMGQSAPGLNTCTITTQPGTPLPGPEAGQIGVDMIKATPVPSRGADDIHLPHFRQEIGPFIGFAAGVLGGGSTWGYRGASGAPRAYAEGEIGVRFGVGMEALTGASGAGLAFLQVGVAFQTAQQDNCAVGGCGSDPIANSAVPRVSARDGLALRARIPFWLIPGDLIIAGPFLVLLDRQSLKRMAIQAGSGGLIPWQRTFNSPIGAFQFIAGREIGVGLYGYLKHGVQNVGYDGVALYGYSYRSAVLDFPIVEYRPFRSFATNQALTLALQFGMGVDIPNNGHRLDNAAPVPDLGSAFIFYLRLAFDARYYP